MASPAEQLTIDYEPEPAYVEGAGQPSFQTPQPEADQGDRIDRLADQGFNYLEARSMAGVFEVPDAA